MSDQKISELTKITGANLADADEFVVVDVSADQTKAVTRAEFFKDTPPITVTGNLTATGDVTIGDDLFVTGPNPVITITETGVNQHRIIGIGGTLYIQAQDSDGTSDGDMHLTGYLNATLNLLNIKAANTTITGDLTIGDDLFLTGPNPVITLTDTDVADEYGKFWHTSGNNFFTARNGAVNGQHIFYQQAGAVQTEAMRVDENGRLGLGVTNPTEKLHVAGNAIVSGDVSIGDGLTVDGIISTTSGTDIDMDASASGQLKLDGNGYGGAIALNEHGMNIYTNSAFRDVIFGTNETERMRIDGSGNVGIGSSAPAAMLYVGGNNTILGGTAGNDINLLTLHADTSNNDLLQFTSERLTTGTNWETAAHRIQRKVDATLMGYMQFGKNDADLITFGRNATEYMRIDGNGHAIIPAGVTLGTAAGVYAAANTLDDYEEGTWTPTTNGDATGSLSAAQGRYVKVGQQVTVWAQFDVGSSFSNNSIGGLPFTVGNLFAISALASSGIAITNIADVTTTVAETSTKINFYLNGDVDTSHNPNTAANVYRLCLSYLVA